MRSPKWLAYLVVCSSIVLPAVADDRPDTALESRRVGLSTLIANDLAAEHRYLGHVLVRLLRERLSGIEEVELLLIDAPLDVLPRQVASSANLDLFVWGEIESISNHLALEMQAFDAKLVRTVWSYQESGDSDVPLASIESIADSLASVLLEGRWSRLVVEPNPVDSSVWVDGVLIGIGTTLLRYTEVRGANLRVSRSGYRDTIQQVALVPFQEIRVNVDLVPVDLGTVLLESQPAGADVYVESAYAGVTPLRLSRFSVETPLSLVLEDYTDTSARIGPNTPDTLSMLLQPSTFDSAEELDSSRDRFYEELGWFVVSLAPPLLLGALVTDFSARDVARNQGGGTISWQPATIGVTIGALASAGHSIYRVVRAISAMIDYTEVAKRPAG